jgi:hypothetical protein
MATYKFEQFNVEITNPTITVHPSNIKVDAINNTISLSVTLEVFDAKFGVLLEGVPVDKLNWEGETNLMERALQGLAKYEI